MRSLLVASLLCVSTVAGADPEAVVEVVPTTGAPVLRATLSNAPLLSPSDLLIRDATTGAAAKASVITPYRDGPETMAIALVYNGQEVYIGNDDLENEESPAHYVGILKTLAQAIDQSSLGTMFPVGSRAMIVTYDQGAKVAVPMGPIDRVNGRALGTQRDYYRRVGTDLVSGVELAIAELHQTPATRKALIVIGDGNDTNNDVANARFTLLKKEAAQDGIQTFAIVYKGMLSEETTAITRMIPNARTIATVDQLPATMTTIVASLADRYYATFPLALPADGKPHDLIIKIGSEELEPVTVMAPLAPASCSSGFGFWTQIAIGGALCGLIAAAMMVYARARASSDRPG